MDADLVVRITRKHGIPLLFQFGSTGTGHEHPHSDIDLGVEFGDVPGSFATFGDAMADLQSLFPGREVDVAVDNRADPCSWIECSARAACCDDRPDEGPLEGDITPVLGPCGAASLFDSASSAFDSKLGPRGRAAIETADRIGVRAVCCFEVAAVARGRSRDDCGGRR